MSLCNVKIALTAILVYFSKFVIEDDEQDLLFAQLAELHAFLDKVALSLTLGVVSVNVILYQAISFFASLCFWIVRHLLFHFYL